MEIPNVTLSPSFDDVQGVVNRAIQLMLQVFDKVYQWGQQSQVPDQMELTAPSNPLISPSVLAAPSQVNAVTLILPAKKPELRTFYRMVSEHKEVAKLVSSLSSMISASKSTVMEAFSHFNKYKDLWQQEQEKEMTEFMEKEPLLSDFEVKMFYYESLEGEITAEEDSIIIGPLCLDASELIYT